MSSAAYPLRAHRWWAACGSIFAWRLGDGRDVPFDVVDMLELGPDGQIIALHIIYDTIEVRNAFEASTGHPSWRSGGSP